MYFSPAIFGLSIAESFSLRVTIPFGAFSACRTLTHTHTHHRKSSTGYFYFFLCQILYSDSRAVPNTNARVPVMPPCTHIQHKSNGDFHPFEIYLKKTYNSYTYSYCERSFSVSLKTPNVHRRPHTIHNGSSLRTRTRACLRVRRMVNSTSTRLRSVDRDIYIYICSAHIHLRNVAKNRGKKSFEPCCWHIMANIFKRIKTYAVLMRNVLCSAQYRVPRTIL